MVSKEKDVLMEFEICGERISLQDYDAVIEKKKEILKDYLPFLHDFPYTIKKLKGDSVENIRDVPVSILYKGKKISLYGFTLVSHKKSKMFNSIYLLNITALKSTMYFERRITFRTMRISNPFHFRISGIY